MNAKEIFINLGNSVEIPINEDLEKALLKDTPGYKVIKDYLDQLEKEVELKDKQLDKACDMLSKMKEATDCWEFSECPFREECSKDSGLTSKELCYNKDKWREVFKR